MSTSQLTIYCTTIILTGLVTGLFYSYSCSVNPGLSNLNDAEYLKAMQSINRAILNPVFFISFLGTAVMLAVSAFTQYKSGAGISFYCMISAFAIYAVAVFFVTIAGNVPLNEALDKQDLNLASTSTLKSLRASFEAPWNRYHAVRTIASVVSFILSTLSILKLK